MPAPVSNQKTNQQKLVQKSLSTSVFLNLFWAEAHILAQKNLTTQIQPLQLKLKDGAFLILENMYDFVLMNKNDSLVLFFDEK